MFQLRTLVALLLVCYFASSQLTGHMVAAESDEDLLTSEVLDVASISSKRYEMRTLPKSEQCVRVWEQIYDMIHPPAVAAGYDYLPANLRPSRGPMNVGLMRKAAEILSTRRGAKRAMYDFIVDCSKELASLQPAEVELEHPQVIKQETVEPAAQVTQPLREEQPSISRPTQKLVEHSDSLERQVAQLKSELQAERAKSAELAQSLAIERTKVDECEARQLKVELQRQQAIEEGKSRSSADLSAKLHECETRSEDQASRINKMKQIQSKLEEQVQASMANLDKCLAERLGGVRETTVLSKSGGKVAEQKYVELQRNLNECEAKHLKAESKATRLDECQRELGVKKQELERALFRSDDLLRRISKIKAGARDDE